MLELAEERAKEMMVLENKRRAQYQQEIKDISKAQEQKRAVEQMRAEQERVQALINK